LGLGLRIRFSKSAVKFLGKVNKKKEEKIRLMLKKLLLAVEEGIVPFTELKIKKLDGKWKGRFRMRTDGIRIIYRIDKEEQEIYV
jgi:mRNA-degrading endonuclease RelE of RelBE toxin-antitoxin system